MQSEEDKGSLPRGLSLRGANAIVTGGGSGIGCGIARSLVSAGVNDGYANAGPYCASKFGLVGLSEALQVEVRKFGITVHSLCPALVQVPPPRNGGEVNDAVLQVEDLASTVMFLLTQPRRIKYDNIGLYHL